MKNSKCDNNTGAQGGCIAANNANNLGFVNVSLDGNHAQNGGGLYALGCTELVVYNATMQRNTAAVNGGGVFQVSRLPRHDGQESGVTFDTSCFVEHALMRTNKIT